MIILKTTFFFFFFFFFAIDFNTEDNEPVLFLFIINSIMIFQNTRTVATGLSNFHKMIVTVYKTFFPKSKPKEIVYKSYLKFVTDAFQVELNLKLQTINNYESFQSVFLSVLNKRAPLKKKFIRGNQAPYMIK